MIFGLLDFLDFLDQGITKRMRITGGRGGGGEGGGGLGNENDYQNDFSSFVKSESILSRNRNIFSENSKKQEI
jgi:hypothetical protein